MSNATIALPTARSIPDLSIVNANCLVFGEPKVGKSTLASQIEPDTSLFIATEPGLKGLSVFAVDVRSWLEFLEVCGQLATTEHKFTRVVIDTVDNLADMCQQYVIDTQLGGVHPGSVDDYGASWKKVNDEFKHKILKLSGLNVSLWFVSHAKTTEVKQTVGTKTVIRPAVSGGMGSFLDGFVDHIFYVAREQDEDGLERPVLRTRATETYRAGGRGEPLPDPLPLDGKALTAAMGAAVKAPKATK